MAATAAQIAQVRRMTGEPTNTTYSDEVMAGYIETYPLLDALGQEPFTWDTSTEPATQDANESWIATYDLHAAAGDIWEEKAAVVSARFDFSADGGNYSRSQEYDHCMAQARYHRSRRSPKTITQQTWPNEDADLSWIGNLPEDD